MASNPIELVDMKIEALGKHMLQLQLAGCIYAIVTVNGKEELQWVWQNEAFKNEYDKSQVILQDLVTMRNGLKELQDGIQKEKEARSGSSADR